MGLQVLFFLMVAVSAIVAYPDPEDEMPAEWGKRNVNTGICGCDIKHPIIAFKLGEYKFGEAIHLLNDQVCSHYQFQKPTCTVNNCGVETVLNDKIIKWACDKKDELVTGAVCWNSPLKAKIEQCQRRIPADVPVNVVTLRRILVPCVTSAIKEFPVCTEHHTSLLMAYMNFVFDTLDQLI